MTFDELKESVKNLLISRREVSLPDGAIVAQLAYDAMEDIANRYIVPSLLTKKRGANILREVGVGEYINMPAKPSEDMLDESLDIDIELHRAIAFMVAASICSEKRNSNIFSAKGKKIIKDYSFKIYKTQQRSS